MPTRRLSSMLNGVTRGTGGQFRREALARKDLNWPITDSRLYNEAFTGRAKAVARCSFCLREDHASAVCPCNPACQITSFPSEIPSGRQPCCSHQPPTSHRPPARWRIASGSMTSVASFLTAAFAMPVCSAADHTPSRSEGHSSIRGADHQVVIRGKGSLAH